MFLVDSCLVFCFGRRKLYPLYCLTGVVIIFKTAAGKYGAMNIVYTNQNAASKDTYVTIDVKIEK